ncbi:MAG: DNA-directed RNA polymerase subunit N [Nitrososphaerota archaeon]
MFPIRCFSCGSLIADKWEEYKRRVDAGEEPGKILDNLGVKRYCCRRMFLSHVEVFEEEIVRFSYQFGKGVKKIGETNNH